MGAVSISGGPSAQYSYGGGTRNGLNYDLVAPSAVVASVRLQNAQIDGEQLKWAFSANVWSGTTSGHWEFTACTE